MHSDSSCNLRNQSRSIINVVAPVSGQLNSCLQTLESHSCKVNPVVVFLHDSTRLASASFDGTVKVWDAGSGACLQMLEGHTGSVNSVIFSHDSTRFASASSDNTVEFWDTGSGAHLQTIEGHSGGELSALSWHYVGGDMSLPRPHHRSVAGFG